MAKRGGNHPVPGHFTLQGAQVEDRDAARNAKAALGREAARRRRRAGRKTKLGAAPKEQRAKEPPKPGTPPSSTVLAAAHDRELADKVQRKPAPKRVKPSPEPVAARRPAAAAGARREETGAPEPQMHAPRYLADAARGVIRRVARVAFAPVALARAVVDRFRDRD